MNTVKKPKSKRIQKIPKEIKESLVYGRQQLLEKMVSIQAPRACLEAQVQLINSARAVQ